MPTWTLRYPTRDSNEHRIFQEEIRLLQGDRNLASLQIREDPTVPNLMGVEVQFRDLGPENPQVSYLLNSKGTVMRQGLIPSIWGPMQVSRIVPGTPVGIDPTSGGLTMNGDNPVGFVVSSSPPSGLIGIFDPSQMSIEAPSTFANPEAPQPNLSVDMIEATVREIQESFDRQIFQDLEASMAATPLRSELTVMGADEPHRLPLGWTVTENIGIGVVNPRAIQAQRVTVPEFEIISNPTIRVDDIRQRRFDLIDRSGPT